MTQDVQKYVEMDVDSLVPYENNARTHSEEQVDKIVKSIEEFGFINPVLVNKDNVIIAGHGRVMAAKKMGRDKVPCLFVEHLSDEQMRAYVIADNKLAEEAGWDMEMLSIELSELDEIGFDISLTGFDFRNSEWFEKEDRFTNTDGETEEYKEFLEKFEQEKTTDDCYTPDNIYEVVVAYV